MPKKRRYIFHELAAFIADIFGEILSDIGRAARRSPWLFLGLPLIAGLTSFALKILDKSGQLKGWLENSVQKEIIFAAGGVAVISFFAQSMLRYLRTDFDPLDKFNQRQLSSLYRRLDSIEHASEGLAPEVRSELVQSLKNDATKEMGSDFEKHLQELYGSAMLSVSKANHVRRVADKMLSRLQTEVRALMRRGNLNLVLGFATTAAAATLLGFVALTVNINSTDWRHYMPTFIIRLSLVTFIEVFSFFFLRLYRTSLTEIKYFQNEITNLEAKCLALEYAILSDDKDAAESVIRQLAKTERNFVLKKGETTLELEKARLDHQQLGEVIGAIKKALPSGKDKGETTE